MAIQRFVATIALFALAGGHGATAQTPAPTPTPRMKAIVYHEFGGPDVLRLEDVDTPVPGDHQILVKVRAVSVNPLDWHFLEGEPYLGRLAAFGLLKPASPRLGVDFAGTVEAIGKDTTAFKPGDEVYGDKFGAFAEYVVTSDQGVTSKPATLTFEQAASLPVAALTALQAARDHGRVRPGRRVLINGASGGVGTFAVQIAKAFGAEVTGVCSGRNVELVRSLGADHVIDYTKEDFTTRPERYDVILDNVGSQPLSGFRRVLVPTGTYIAIGGGGVNDNRWTGPLVTVVQMLVSKPFVSQDMKMMLSESNAQDLGIINDLIQSGKVKPVIDKTYPFNELPEALLYLEQGHARGKVVITVPDRIQPLTQAADAAAPSRSTPSPMLIALTMMGVPVVVLVAPVAVAVVANRRYARRHRAARGFRWGYYFSLMAVVGGGVLGLVLVGGTTGVIAGASGYAVLAWFFARRHHWAWIALTVLSFNPIAWSVNAMYLGKRWGEARLTAHSR